MPPHDPCSVEMELSFMYSVSSTVMPDHSGGNVVIEFCSKRKVLMLDM
eukprot:CAMPEP_0177754592 /NCGR_PEP_ID=MMETSP0491_2-20121128/2091_1 /TAXON_ID=63592 /ORGANISM="Tetraselmis chuii, Strain PLY429" /LENGTH=47 /DNA_ID= /DNA_START= /DNA_END= /DNA_ORIENTATION=